MADVEGGSALPEDMGEGGGGVLAEGANLAVRDPNHGDGGVYHTSSEVDKVARISRGGVEEDVIKTPHVFRKGMAGEAS